jgi:hypothetical protein
MTDEILCSKCGLWDLAAKQSGYASGMCEECFNKNFVRLTRPLPDHPTSLKSTHYPEG